MTKLDVSFPAFEYSSFGDSIADRIDLDKVAAEFPRPEDPRWFTFRGEHEPLKRQGMEDCWGTETVKLILELISPAMCQAVAHTLGHRVLVGDTYGGGQHLSGPGAHLDIHTDFNVHPQTGWRRRANALLYLNHGWRKEWGGCLELDHKVTLTPEFGRLVIFETSDRSWHGHPVPISDGHWRKSVACYFYDPLDAVDAHEAHDTIWAEP